MRTPSENRSGGRGIVPRLAGRNRACEALLLTVTRLAEFNQATGLIGVEQQSPSLQQTSRGVEPIFERGNGRTNRRRTQYAVHRLGFSLGVLTRSGPRPHRESLTSATGLR